MAQLADRVVARYLKAQEDDVWLPDLLGGKTRLVNELLAAMKRLPDSPLGRSRDVLSKDPKALAGGLCYFVLKEVAGGSVADKLWNLLDSNAGLSADYEVQLLAGRVTSHLTGPDRKVHAAAIGVALLQRTRQQNKAQKANAILSHVFAREIAEAAPPEAPGEKQTPTRAFAELVASLKGLAQQVAAKLKKDPAKAAMLVWEVLEDVNAYEASSTAEVILSPLGGGTDPQELRKYVSQISGAVDYGIVEAGAFGVALMEAVGQTSYASKLNRAMVKEFSAYLGAGTVF